MPVSKREIRRWLKRYTRIDPDSPRVEYYVRWYRIREKIAAERETAEPGYRPDTAAVPRNRRNGL